MNKKKELSFTPAERKGIPHPMELEASLNETFKTQVHEPSWRDEQTAFYRTRPRPVSGK